jgi:hypothetical protein
MRNARMVARSHFLCDTIPFSIYDWRVCLGFVPFFALYTVAVHCVCVCRVCLAFEENACLSGMHVAFENRQKTQNGRGMVKSIRSFGPYLWDHLRLQYDF